MEDKIVQPGQTISPTSAGAPEPQQPQAPPPEPPAAPETPTPAPEPAAPAPVPLPAPEEPAPEQQPAPEPPQEDEDPAPEQGLPDAPPTYTADKSEAVNWTASEFIAHAKSPGWYAALALGAIVSAALVYLLTRDPVSSVVIIVAAILLGIYARHKPRELEYRVDFRGLTIGEKHFTFDQFRSFSVMPEGAFSSIVFMPLKRFAVPTTIYYAPEDEDRIIRLLSGHLPLEERGHDAVDRLMHRIHF